MARSKVTIENDTNLNAGQTDGAQTAGPFAQPNPAQNMFNQFQSTMQPQQTANFQMPNLNAPTLGGGGSGQGWDLFNMGNLGSTVSSQSNLNPNLLPAREPAADQGQRYLRTPFGLIPVGAGNPSGQTMSELNVAYPQARAPIPVATPADSGTNGSDSGVVTGNMAANVTDPSIPQFQYPQGFKDFEQRVRDYTSRVQQENIPLEQQQIGALREFSPEVSAWKSQFGENTPRWLDEFTDIGSQLDWRTPQGASTIGSSSSNLPPSATPSPILDPSLMQRSSAPPRRPDQPTQDPTAGPVRAVQLGRQIPIGAGPPEPRAPQGGVPFSIDPNNPLFSLSPFINQYFNSVWPALARGTFTNPPPVGQALQNLFNTSTIPTDFDQYYRQLSGLPVASDISPFGNMVNQSLASALGGGPFANLIDPNIVNQFGGAQVLPTLQRQLQTLADPAAQAGFNQLLGGAGGLLTTPGFQGTGTMPGMGGIIPGMQHLFDQGLPGQGLLTTPGQPLDYSQLLTGASELLARPDVVESQRQLAGLPFNPDKQQGLLPGLQHIFQAGLPGRAGVEDILQRQIEALTGDPRMVIGPGDEPFRDPVGQQQRGLEAINALTGMVSPTQTAANLAIQDVLGQRGLPSPEYVEAARGRLLEPARRDLMGQLNALGGGQGFLQSGLPQELLRRQEQDFLRDLILTGQDTYGQAMGQGLQAGGLGFDQAMQAAQAREEASQNIFRNVLGAYGAIPQAELPAMQLGADIQGQLANQALQRYGAVGSQGLDVMRTGADIQQALTNQALQRATTLGQLGQIPFDQAMQAAQLRSQMIPEALQRERYAGDFAQQNLSQAMNFLQAMNQFNMGQQDIQASLLRTLLTGTAQTQGGGILGGLIGKGIEALPGVAAAFSSQQFKRDVRPLGSTKDTLDIVNDLEVVNFKYHWEAKDHVGIILENSHPILTTEDGTKVDVDIIGVLVGAIQEQQKQIAELKEQING